MIVDKGCNYTVKIDGDLILNFFVYIGTKKGLIKEKELGDIRYIDIDGESNIKLSKFDREFKKALNLKFDDDNKFKDDYSFPKFNGIKDQYVKDAFLELWEEFIKWWSMPSGACNILSYISRCRSMTINRYAREDNRDINIGIIYIDFKGIIEGDNCVLISANNFVNMSDFELKNAVIRKIS